MAGLWAAFAALPLMQAAIPSDARVVARSRVCVLRTWRPDDEEWYAGLVANPRVMRYIGDGTPRSRARAAAEIRGFREETRVRGWSRWVVETAGRVPAGYVGFSFRDGRVDWGGRCLPRFWGTPMILDAAILALRTGLRSCGITRAEATTVLENRGAWRLNQALGFRTIEHYAEGGIVMIRQEILRADDCNERWRSLEARMAGSTSSLRSACRGAGA